MALATHVSNALGSSPVSCSNNEPGQRRGQNREPSLEEETSQICSKVKDGLQNLQNPAGQCDEARPSCLKCQSTGRTCDGFDMVPRCVEAGVTTSQHHHTRTIVAASCGLFDSCATVNVQLVPSPYCQNYHSLPLRNLRPFMMLPAIAPTQTEARSFFELISIKYLNEYYPSDSWRKTLMFFLQTVPSLRHAAITLALPQLLLHAARTRTPVTLQQGHPVLIARAMRLQWMAQEASFADGVPANTSKQVVIGQLETWSHHFEEMLNHSSHYATDTESYHLILLLRLQNTILWILFQQCIAMADDVTAAHQLYAGSSKPAFTPEGPRGSTTGRESPAAPAAAGGVWDNAFAARVVERIAEIEEGKAGGVRGKSMDEIAVWQRIECVSWEQVVSGQSVARMEFWSIHFAKKRENTPSLS
ncbi:hypothetical protein DPV78_011237 [Talaromyces pinophilus]|nr:hypothetical protein DPV78_011237 [Talaromyces pinophilus]